MKKIKNNFDAARSRKEIAAELCISRTTFWRKLKRNKINLPSGLIYAKDLKKIYKIFKK